MCRYVACGGMTDRDRRVRSLPFLAQQRGHRFADNVAAAEHDDFRAFGFHTRTHQQFYDTRRCAGPKTGRVTEHQLADVQWMKTVHIFLRQHSGENNRFPDLFW